MLRPNPSGDNPRCGSAHRRPSVARRHGAQHVTQITHQSHTDTSVVVRDEVGTGYSRDCFPWTKVACSGGVDSSAARFDGVAVSFCLCLNQTTETIAAASKSVINTQLIHVRLSKGKEEATTTLLHSAALIRFLQLARQKKQKNKTTQLQPSRLADQGEENAQRNASPRKDTMSLTTARVSS